MTRSGPIRPCRPSDVDDVLRVVNDGARAYRGIIPDASWREPGEALARLAGAWRKRRFGVARQPTVRRLRTQLA